MNVDGGPAVGMQMIDSDHMTRSDTKSVSEINPNDGVVCGRFNGFTVVLGAHALHGEAIVALNYEFFATIWEESTPLYVYGHRKVSLIGLSPRALSPVKSGPLWDDYLTCPFGCQRKCDEVESG